ncbi:hypothetical protein KSP39_PZI003445 [Platanthera zijinensis]|uniref:Gag-pol polyprotein n=1 Tax=Platanthera zijinensis TaxID=2320716 RepID=A0AAP0BX10_9ASPA
MDGGFARGLGIELLTPTNFKKWKSCMKSYLLGEELWEVVGGDDQVEITAEFGTAEQVRVWRKTNAKAEFALKRAVSPELFDHILGCESAAEIWTSLDGLFNRKNVARLQFLENELAKATQGDLSISKFFLKMKSLCAELSALDPDEPISEAKLKRHIIRGLRKEYVAFVTSVQGWATQPSLLELENLLASQESLARQMAGVTVSEGASDALFTEKKKKRWEGKKKQTAAGDESSSSKQQEGSLAPKKDWKKNLKCFRCHQPGHFKRDCKVKLQPGHAAGKEEASSSKEEAGWGGAFMTGTCVRALSTSDLKDDWIVDSGCGHHLTGDLSKFSSLQAYSGNEAIITADNTIHAVEKEGIVTVGSDKGSLTLRSVYHVPGMKKNLFSVTNAVDAGYHVLFGPTEVKFLRNVSAVKADVAHVGRRVKDLFVLSTSSYVDRMRANDSAAMWHERLGHVGMDKLKAMSSRSLVRGLPKLSSFGEGHVCAGCQYGKSHRLPFDKSQTRSNAPLEVIHGDLMGPTATASLGGSRYMLVLIDDYSRYTWVYFLKEKSEAFRLFVEFKELVEGRLNLKIKKLRTDNGGEFVSSEFSNFCRKHGIQRELTCAHTPQQNGVAERKIRHLTETCKCWLHAKSIPRSFWAEGMFCAAYVINRMPLSPINMKSPFEMLLKEKPSVEHLRVFGSTCYVHIPDALRTKLDAKARKLVFVGYDERKKGWRCMDPVTKKFVVSRDVVFDELTSYGGSSVELPESKVDEGQEVAEVADQVELAVSPAAPVASSSGEEASGSGSRGSIAPSLPESRGEQEEATEVISKEQPLRRSKRVIKPPARYCEGNTVSYVSCFFAGPLDEREPASFNEATGVKEWEDAMREEMDALKKNETWDLVPKVDGIAPVTCKWVFKLKKKADGSIERFKARLVARGFSQQYGEDYEETFSPVAKMTSVRMVIALAACQGWRMWQLDVKNAFLYGEIDKDIFMDQPLGFVSEVHPDYVCKLRKALYGLKQAPRAWYGKIAEYLQFCGYLASNSDSSLFIKKKGELSVLVLLYVDDMIITGNSEEEVARLRAELAIRFEMKDLGELHHFLGLEVERKESGILVCQKGYAERIVNRFGLIEGKTCSTPMDQGLKLRRDEGRVLPDPLVFRALIGSLIYLTITRPDIAYAVGRVSRFMAEPRKSHLVAAKNILKYVKATSDMGLLYRRDANFSLLGYTDADYGGDSDDRRSTSGYVFTCGSAGISWCSKKQDSVSVSTTEAEYKASALAAREAIWLRRLVDDVHEEVQGPTLLRGDNESALKLVNNPVCHARTKHIEIDHHFIREKVLEGSLVVGHVRSEDNLADIFTKSLSKGPFQRLRGLLGLITTSHFKGEC